MSDSDNRRDDSALVHKIRAGDEGAFEEMFYTYYSGLCAFAAQYVDSYDRARGVVQDVFLRIWQGRASWEVTGELKPYLYQAVRNQALNAIDRRKRFEGLREGPVEDRSLSGTREQFYEKELARAIWSAIDELPHRRRMAFVLHRQHGLSYEQVGEVMGITAKTVENQIGRALKDLRAAVAREQI